MIQEVMTVEQVAKYLQLDAQTVYRKARAGQIPAVRIGKTIRFKKEVIDGWLTMSSLKWSAGKRKELRAWAEGYSLARGMTESMVHDAIAKKRRSA